MAAWLKNNWLIALVLVIAFLLRFVCLFEYEFSFDELSALDRTQFKNFSDLINKGVLVDAHPALIQVFLFYWIKIGGSSEAWVKLPFLLCGFLSCLFIFRFANKWFGYRAGVISAIVVSCSMIFLIYSSYARMYITGVLFSILSLHYLFEIVFGNSIKFKDYLFLSLFLLLGALNHHMGALFGLLIGILGFIISGKKQKTYLLYTAIITILFYLPHLSITLTQTTYSIAAGEGGWLTAPKWYACFSFLKALFGTGLVIYFFIIVFAYAGIKTKFSFLADKKTMFLFIVSVLYYFVIYFYSVFKTPVLQFSALLIGAPCIIIVVAKGLSFIPDRLFNITCFALIIVFLVQTIFVKQYYLLGIKQSHKSAVKQTMEAKNKYGADNVTAIYDTETFFVTRYMNEFKTSFKCLTAFDSTLNNPVLLSRHLKSLKENYILISDPDPALLEKIKVYFPYLIYHNEGYFESVFLLSKKNDNSITDESIIKTSTPKNPEGFIFSEKFAAENNCILIDSTNEFPFGIWADFNSLSLKEGQSIVCKSVFKPTGKMDNLSFDFNVKKNDSSLFYSSRNFKDFYVPEDSLQYGFSSIFIGTEINKWKNSKLECYFWNSGKKRYLVKDVNLKIIDINPHKYTLWD